jgi:predicted dehydrogenase
VHFAEHAELVALCDPSQVRMAFWNRLLGLWGVPPVPTYPAAAFRRMIGEQRPDVVIVCSVDATHHEYTAAALELGCDVITEKPMATDAEKARLILDAAERSGRRVTVAFNYRFAPSFTRLRQVVAEGRIGTPLLVDFQWVLDTNHGADYFRRWHRQKENSGGLLVHKATHHFDLVNFWVDSLPEEVFAMGGLRFYGRANAEARGEARPYVRYTGEAAARDDPFRLVLDENEGLRGLYLEAEAETGYLRDQNVFGDGISIEDTLGVLARYRSGVQLVYSLVAYAPWEGLRVCITGTRGRAELFETQASHVVGADAARPPGGPPPEAAATALSTAGRFLHVHPMFAPPYAVPIPAAEGGHGGGDALLVRRLFDLAAPPDPFGRSADHWDGAASIALGIAANRSLESGRPVRVDELLPLRERRRGGPQNA